MKDQQNPREVMVLNDPEAIQALLHEKKRRILGELIAESRKIIDLKRICGINPGTISRHLKNLIEVGLVFPPVIEINEKNIKEKYYRATARKYKAYIEFP